MGTQIHFFSWLAQGYQGVSNGKREKGQGVDLLWLLSQLRGIGGSI